jgi:hypothetical protein
MHEGRELMRGAPEAVVNDERVIEAYLGERYARRARGDGPDSDSGREPEGGDAAG